MAPTNGAKSASVADEKKKLLQQYKNDEGHFSLVRQVDFLLSDREASQRLCSVHTTPAPRRDESHGILNKGPLRAYPRFHRLRLTLQ